MTTGIYLSAMTQDSGKSLIALGLADSLVKRADRVGFFRPIFKGETASDDPMIRLMKEHFNLSDEQVGGAVSLTEALEFIAEGNTEEISARAVSAYEEIAAHSDVVIVDGIYLTAQNALAVEFDLNAQVSRDLGLPVIAVVGANEASLEEATNAAAVAGSALTAATVGGLLVAPMAVLLARSLQRDGAWTLANYTDLGSTGGRSALITLVERTSRFVLIHRLGAGHDSQTVTTALQTMVADLPRAVRASITWDQGSEMARHADFTAATDIPVYFADPHSPWQRPTNENTNRLIREYLPKGTSFTDVTDTQVQAIQDRLNRRPRIVLNGQTPTEKLNDIINGANTT